LEASSVFFSSPACLPSSAGFSSAFFSPLAGAEPASSFFSVEALSAAFFSPDESDAVD
jgi:hypothetical protein